ncbi:soluble lytic murein transglycosylase [Halanaerobium sp. ST460_2HS_T2]|uniref:Soluble lytic murein transglycosylase n=1 Tax=Halanaerobium kushneri TaxID=56779 RepID=A0A1N6Y345_9FIRM|nr:soluble lytic murein transglycosylase [Halanaerobium sp. ST460_2HS_T2]SIR08990.1 soluble lytic murein transglycosylase [Halanaerobium kushneri]
MVRKYLIKGIIFLLLSIILLITINSNFDFWTIRRNLEPVKYKKQIDKYSKEFSLEPELLAAIIYVESRFNKYSISPKGAVGLMQLMPATANWVAKELGYKNFSLKDLDNPDLNIKFGSWYFSYLYQKFDQNLIKTIAAYNAGERNVQKWINNGWNADLKEELPFAETDSFVRRVISTKDYYSKNNLKIYSLSTFDLLLANFSE